MKLITNPLKLASILIGIVAATTLTAQDYVPKQLIIKWKTNRSTTQKTAFRSEIKAKKGKQITSLEVEQLIFNANDNRNLEDIIATYCEHPMVEYVEFNHTYQLFDNSPNDPNYPSQWALDNTGQTGGTVDADIDAVQAWDINTDCSGVVIGVVDSGIDWRHEDLAENIWQNLAEDADGDGKVIEKINGVWQFDPDDLNGIDDDGNGYTDDLVGWDFLNGDNDPSDGLEHGTHVAGIIGAKGNNNIGISGVCWEAQLAALRFIGNNRIGNAFDAAAAIDYAVQVNMPISNHSYGNYFSNTTLDLAIQNAQANGHLIVAAAGNGGQDTVGDDNDITNVYPASLPHDNIISVAATNENDQKAVFSNYGANTVDIAAPGKFIQSCYPNDNYGVKSGTSMAAPMVTGACALYKQFYPNRTYQDIVQSVLITADPITSMNGRCTSNGRLNANNLLSYSGVPLCRYRDSLALVDLYNSTNGANWTTTWDLSQPIDTWNGVTLDGGECVKWIDLGSNNLVGILPVSIGNFQNLKSLILKNNSLNSSIPISIGKLTKLINCELNNNNFSGTIPIEFSNIRVLEVLSLGYNNLTGYIPKQLSQIDSLEYLSMYGNNLTGAIPKELGNLSKLKNLFLGENQLDGYIPIELGNLSNLVYLYLNNNLIAGAIPKELANLTNLLYLNLQYNQLSGCFSPELSIFCGIPTHPWHFENNPNLPGSGDLDNFCNNNIGSCSSSTCRVNDSLSLVEIYNNTNGNSWTNGWDLNQPIDSWFGVTTNTNGCVTKIDLSANNLNGDIPAAIGQFEYLTELRLSNNSIDQIPIQIGNLQNLEILSLRQNNISGNIPLAIFNLNVRFLDLRGNNFSGSLPSEVENLSNIRTLKISGNQLSGFLPSNIGNLQSLEDLRIDNNNFTAIPNEIGNLYNLSNLWAQGNSFISIPAGIGDLNSLEYLYLHSNSLSGNIPVLLCNLNNLRYLYLHNNNLSGNIPIEVKNLINIEQLIISNNQLTGIIPSELGNLNTLSAINAESNDLSGCFPSTLSNLCGATVDFSNNPNLPNGGDFAAFCAIAAGECEPGLVWPGDFNADGIANADDALYWGLAEGTTGITRTNPTNNWQGQSCPDWSNEVLGVNNKHQDADGNGIIDAADFVVFENNLGSTYASGITTFDYDLKTFELQPTGQIATATYGYDLYIHDFTGDAIIHGASCKIDFNALPVEDITVDFSTSSLSPSHTVTQYDPTNNRLSLALTRSDKQDQLCIGPIAKLEIVIEDDLPSGDPFNFYIGSGSTSTALLDTINSVGASSAFAIFEDLSVFNTADSLHLQINAVHERCEQLGRARVDLQGGLAPFTVHWSTGHNVTINDSFALLNNLTSGQYTVTVTDSNGLSKSQTFDIYGQFITDYDEFGNPIGCDGAVCEPMLNIQNTVITGTYHADIQVQSTGLVDDQSNVTYKAGTNICLDAGFEIELGAEFSAEIEDCTGN